MPDVYIIMGDKNSRKSSTIRALTSASKYGAWKIQTINHGIINIYVQIVALQEEGTSPQDFIKFINDEYPNFSNLIFTLRIKRDNNQPDAEKYVEEFIKAKWNLKEIVVFINEYEPNLSKLPFYYPIFGTAEMPANKIASIIRRNWEWF